VRYLWDIYESLKHVDLAASSAIVTSQEEKNYKDALKVLFEKGEDGRSGRQDSQALIAYNQCRDAWFKAHHDYNEKRISAEFSNDFNRTQWRDKDEPSLRAKIDEVEKRWNINNRAKVEEAQRIVASYGNKNPELIWSKWMEMYNESIDKVTNPGTNEKFVQTTFAPSNAFSEIAWQKFSLTREEAKKLISEAPTDLKHRLFPTEQVDIDIDSLSFEYSSVVVKRHWLATDLFRARFWKFTDGNLFSDGQIETIGMCPAYVAALIFVRNLEIRLKSNSQKNGILNLGFLSVKPPRGYSANSSGAKNVDERNKDSLVVSSAATKIKLKDYQRNPHIPIETKTTDDFMIMALICKRLPKSPDPDPKLQW
jgi:hypothetical protein